ncbi:hypothetical protein EDD86DRAFT_247294 [Gorgonomyces haynaldii]|nr:hypothetical protein EDD86DRAFT_247294 [Gorgonomyces haynaldii]
MQLERQKPTQTKKKTRERVIEQVVVESSSWDALIPSAPETKPIYPTTMYQYQEDYDMLAPSAPSQTLYPSAPVLAQERPEELELEDLELDEDDPLLMEAILDFESFSLSGDQDDPFYQKLQAYRQSFEDTTRIKESLKQHQTQAQSSIARVWSLNRTYHTVSANCGDGWTSLYHRYANETAVYSQSQETSLKESIAKMKQCLAKQFPEASFKAKMARAWIQDCIDEMLSDDFGDHVQLLQQNRTFYNSLSQHQQVLQRLSNMLDVLFYFNNLHQTNDFFSRDVRSWISTVAECLLIAGGYAHRISKWGTQFVQWPLPNVYAPEFVENYLLCFSAFLRPSQETEKVLQQQRWSDEDLDDGETLLEEWIVVDEPVFQKAKHGSLLLTDEDYHAILHQFAVPDVALFLIKTQEKEGFLFCHRLLQILTRGLSILPPGYTATLDSIGILLSCLTDLFSSHISPMPQYQRANVFEMTLKRTYKSNVQLETDLFLGRAVHLVLKKPGMGLWACLKDFSLGGLSQKARTGLLNGILNGKQWKRGKSGEELDVMVQYLISTGSDAPYLFTLIRELMNLSDGVDLEKRVIQLCFDLCFRNADLQEILEHEAISTIAQICNNRPAAVSQVLANMLSGSESVQQVMNTVFERIVLKRWEPTLEDVQLLSDMLKDPLQSPKSKLCRYIIDQTHWQHLSAHVQRQLAVQIVNVYLDTRDRKSTIKQVARKGLQAASAVIPLGDIRSESQLFLDWCWDILGRLRLYVKPQSLFTYELSGGDASPFKSLSSASLTTIRAHCTSDPVAAYVYLVLSELGHNFDNFQSSGWELLKIVVKSGRNTCFHQATFEIFYTFYTQVGSSVFETAESSLVLKMFWTQKEYSDSAEDMIKFMEMMPWNDQEYNLTYWTWIVFSNKHWISSKVCLLVMNRLAQLSYEHNILPLLNKLLTQEYKNMIMQPATGVVSAIRTITEKTLGTISFPTLVPLRQWMSIDIFDSAFSYYAFAGLVCETLAEQDLRRKIGDELAQNKQLTPQALQPEIKKPLQMFGIYRWLSFLLEMQVSNPLLFPYLQVFFTLYFESSKGIVYGHRFLDDDQVSKLKEKLSLLKLELSKFDRLPKDYSSLLSGFSIWLSGNHQVLPEYFSDCVHSVCFIDDRWWTDQVSNLQELLPSAPSLVTRESIVMEKPVPLPLLSFRKPLLPQWLTMSPEDCLHIIIKDMERLMGKAKTVQLSLSQLDQLDQELLQDLHNLYSNVIQKGSVHKKCSKACQGVVFDFEYNEALLSTHASERVQKWSVNAQAFYSSDPVDHLTCIGALKILRVLERLKDLLLGSSLLILSQPQETDKIFEHLKESKSQQLLAKVFDPMCVAEKFVHYYTILAERSAERLVFDKFDIPKWSAQASLNERIDFMKILANLVGKMNSDVYETHLQVLLGCGPEWLEMDLVEYLSERIFDGSVISKTVSSKRVGFFFQTDFEPRMLTEVFKRLVNQLLNTENPQHADECFRLLTTIASCNVFFVPASELVIQELWCQLTQVCAFLLEKHCSFSQEIFQWFYSFCEEMCKFLKAEQEICNYIWQFYSLLVTRKISELQPVETMISRVPWHQFKLNQAFFSQLFEWKQNGLLQDSKWTQIVSICKSSTWSIDPQDFVTTERALVLILSLFQEIDHLYPLLTERYQTFLYFISCLREDMIPSRLPPALLRQLYQSLPSKWFGRAPVLSCGQDDECYPLPMCLTLVKMIRSASENVINDADVMYLSYVADLIGNQTNAELKRDLLSVTGCAFDESVLGTITNQLLLEAEQMERSSLEFCLKRVFSLLNATSKKDPAGESIESGIIQTISRTVYPLVYLKQLCASLASSEQMAILSEMCIERFVRSHADPQCWKQAEQHLIVPELDETTFVRHCLSHCLSYTLYCQLLQKLSAAHGNQDLEIMIGEHKIIILLTLLFKILVQELQSLDMNDHHSRLKAHLPPIIDTLFRWSEDPASQSIWTTLGFGARSKLSPGFKVYCRFLATFLATRILGPDATDKQQRLMDEFRGLESHADYKQIYVFDYCNQKLKDRAIELQHINPIVMELNRTIFPSEIV